MIKKIKKATICNAHGKISNRLYETKNQTLITYRS